MRICLTLLLGFSLLGSSAFAEYEGRIASYEQLMSMTPQARIKYMAGVRELMVMMERQQLKYERASYSLLDLEWREKFATVMQLFQILPEAYALDDSIHSLPAHKKNPKGVVNAPAATAIAIAAPAVSTATSPPPAEPAAPASPPVPATSNGGGGTPGSCETPQFHCDASDAEAMRNREAQIHNFRNLKGDESNVCISGGFFSSYKNPAQGRVKGGCKIPNAFPFPSKVGEKPFYTCPGSGQALCNPMLYCLNVIKTDKDPLHLSFHCEGYGGKSGDNITERCDQWYNSTVALKSYKDASGVDHPIQACDPKNSFGKLASSAANKSVQQGWTDLKDSLDKNYQTYCMKNTAGFQALFCNECDKMAKHIYAMNKAALGAGCADSPATPNPLIPANGSSGISR